MSRDLAGRDNEVSGHGSVAVGLVLSGVTVEVRQVSDDAQEVDDELPDELVPAELPVLVSPWVVSYLGYPLAGFASLAAYGFTEELGVAVAALAIGAVWPDFVAALWIAWNDRDWPRRVGLVLCHVACGLSYSVVLALFLLLGAGVAVSIFPQLGLFRFGRGELLIIGMLVWAGLAALFSILAVAWCLALGLSIWIDRHPLDQVVHAQWPPRTYSGNEASVPIYVAIVTVIPLPFIAAMWLDRVAPWIVASGWLGTLLLMGLSLKYFFSLKDRIVAELPAECWPELLETDRDLS